MASFGYNARNGDRLRTTQLRVGIVGPSAQGKQVQNGWHKIIGTERFEGWDNQLHDEPVFQLVHERMRRWPAVNADGWGWDAIAHWGGSVGNRSEEHTSELKSLMRISYAVFCLKDKNIYIP